MKKIKYTWKSKNGYSSGLYNTKKEAIDIVRFHNTPSEILDKAERECIPYDKMDGLLTKWKVLYKRGFRIKKVNLIYS